VRRDGAPLGEGCVASAGDLEIGLD